MISTIEEFPDTRVTFNKYPGSATCKVFKYKEIYYAVTVGEDHFTLFERTRNGKYSEITCLPTALTRFVLTLI